MVEVGLIMILSGATFFGMSFFAFRPVRQLREGSIYDDPAEQESDDADRAMLLGVLKVMRWGVRIIGLAVVLVGAVIYVMSGGTFF